MRSLIFQQWCHRAVAGVLTNPEREQVSRELYNHIEDHYQALISQGVEPKEAERLAVEAMGSAEDLAVELAAIYRPMWGRLYSITKWTIAFLIFLVVVSFGFYFLLTRYVNPAYVDYDPYAVPSLGNNEQQLMYLEPNSIDNSDGYILNLKRASLWSAEYTDGSGTVHETLQLNCQIESFTPFPWASTPDYSGWFWAIDDLGNYYYCEYEDSMAQEPSINAKDYRTGMLTYVHELWLRPYVSQDARWIELHYDRSGRDIVLHIDLSGGDAP